MESPCVFSWSTWTAPGHIQLIFGPIGSTTFLISEIHLLEIWVFPKIINGTPKSSTLIGFSLIKNTHIGVPLFLETSSFLPRFSENVDVAQMPLKHKLGVTVKNLSDVLKEEPLGICDVFFFGVEILPSYMGIFHKPL